MKRIIAWGLIFVNLAFLGLLFYQTTNSSTEIKKAEFEPLEKEIKPTKEVDVQKIMDKLVRTSKDLKLHMMKPKC